jgi:hypothetical protein
MLGEFTVTSLSGYEKGDIDLFHQTGLPHDSFVQSMFLMGVAHIRAEVRHSVASGAFEWRSLGVDGRYLYTPCGKGDDQAMRWQDIAAYCDPAQKEIQDAFLKTYMAERENYPAVIGEDNAPKFDSTCIPKEKDGVINIDWVRHQKALKDRKLNSLKGIWNRGAWGHSNATANQPTAQSIYTYLDRMSTDVAMQKMDKKVHLAQTIWKHRDELFGTNDCMIRNAMAFSLADDIIIADCQAKPATECEEKALQGRRNLYGENLIALGESMVKINENPALIDVPDCTAEMKTLALIKSYDLLANKLRWASDLATKDTKQRKDILKLCAHLIQNPNTEVCGLWKDMEREAVRVQTMIRGDIFTPLELRS